MSDESPPPSRDKFDERLRQAVAKRKGDGKRGNQASQGSGGLGFALRIASDMVAGLGVGVGIGLALDWWLETKPWFLIVFFVLGSAAGMLNVYRTAAGYDHGVGYKKRKDRPSGPEAKD